MYYRLLPHVSFTALLRLVSEYNELTISTTTYYAQVICTPVAPRCTDCTLSPSGLGLCPSARAEKLVKKKLQSKVVKKGKAKPEDVKKGKAKPEDVKKEEDMDNLDVDMHAEAKMEDLEDVGMSAGVGRAEGKAEVVDELVAMGDGATVGDEGVNGVKTESES